MRHMFEMYVYECMHETSYKSCLYPHSLLLAKFPSKQPELMDLLASSARYILQYNPNIHRAVTRERNSSIASRTVLRLNWTLWLELKLRPSLTFFQHLVASFLATAS